MTQGVANISAFFCQSTVLLKSTPRRAFPCNTMRKHHPHQLGTRLGTRHHHTRKQSSTSTAASGSTDSTSPFDKLDLNQLQTALNNAIAAENYELAAKIRDVLTLALIATDDPTSAALAAVPGGDWRRLHITDWISDRAEDLGYRLPTEIQRRAAIVIADRHDCVIEAETGSGKTLAFLLPVLSLLRYPPQLYTDDLHGPAALIVVPTRELGVQSVMLIYKLFGGSVNPGVPGGGANMFTYQGPRGLKVRGLLLGDEVEMAVQERYLDGAHVVVGTPDLIAQALERGVEVAQHCDAIVVDEVDACTAAFPSEMKLIFDAALGKYTTNAPVSSTFTTPLPSPQSLLKSAKERTRPEVVLVGATLEEGFEEKAVQLGWVQDPIHVRVGGRMHIPAGLQHRYIVAEPSAKVGAMCRQLRADLKTANEDAAPARVMLFAESEDQARAISDPLRTVLWGDHAISVLLPGGMEPIKALHSFRDNQTTLLIATPTAARGLDLPAVSHVYNISPPVNAADYLHRAGRAGRIGSPVRGLVTTMAAPEEVAGLLAVAAALGIELIREEAPPRPTLSGEGDDVSDVEEAKRALEAVLAFSPSSPPSDGGDGDDEVEFTDDE